MAAKEGRVVTKITMWIKVVVKWTRKDSIESMDLFASMEAFIIDEDADTKY